MNEQVYYYTAVSGRTTFVTFQKGKDGAEWTNQKMSVKRSSISDLRPFSDLKGTKVKLRECEGVIVGCHPVDELIEGKYIGESKYLGRKDVLNRNHLVRVFWTKGVAPIWQPFYKLSLL